MHDKLRYHLNTIFNQMPQTRRAQELKEEMYINLREKYDDLISEGKTPDEAYSIAIASIGDISSLFDPNEDYPSEPTPQQRKKSAILVAVAVSLYILCVVPMFVLEMLGLNESLGVIFMFLIVAVATGILIYNNYTKPKYTKRNETMVEEFKQWQSENGIQGVKRKGTGLLGLAYWSLVLAAYFLISFTTFAWHLTWIIFLIAASVWGIIMLVLSLKEDHR